MYSTKFFWNCPYCKALNSYCPKVESNVSNFQQLNDDISTTEIKCHYCNSLVQLCTDKDMVIKSRVLLGKIDKILTISVLPEVFYRKGKERDFVNENKLKLGIIDELEVCGFYMRDRKEVNFTVDSYNSVLRKFADSPVSERLFHIKIRNVLEFNDALSRISNIYRTFKIPFEIKEDFVVTPDVFNFNNIIISVKNKGCGVEISYSLSPTEKMSDPLCFFYPAAELYDADFKNSLKFIAGS